MNKGILSRNRQSAINFSSFFDGMGNVFFQSKEIQTKKISTIRTIDVKSNAQILHEDWQKVGDDIRFAMIQYGKTNG